MTENDVAGIPLGDNADLTEAAEIVAAISKALHGRGTGAALVALSIVVADAIEQASSEDLGQKRSLFSGFAWTLHAGLEGLAATVAKTGNALNLTSDSLPADERAALVAAIQFLSNLFAGLLSSLPANVVLSGVLSAIVSLVCSMGDETSVKLLAMHFRRIAKSLPAVKAGIVAASEAAERDEALFSGRATVGDVGRA